MTYNFCINDFEGPLDLLLHLIRSNQMDIYNINVESITKQYVDFINNSKDMNMDIASEYLVMASELIHLKSKLLLHKDDTVEEDDENFEINSEEDLRNKLLAYEEMKRITGEFSILEDKRSEFYTKLPSNLSEYKEPDTIVQGDTTVDDLVNAFKLFLEREKYNKPLNTKITKKEYSVSERSSEIRSILKQRKKCDFTSLFEELTKPYVVVTFLSILEMSKNKEINITQDKTFGNITVEMV
ncbi:MAG: segregation/condensation protein A [Bacilli bacterium]|nr:segregation/condensation protein A [Bacilli bacterium]